MYCPESRRDEVREVMNGIRRIVRALRLSARDAQRAVGISGAQLFVLQQLREVPAESLAELARRTVTDPSSVSTVVSHLVDRGLIARVESRQDRRRVALSLTGKGRALLKHAPQPAQEQMVNTLELLPQGDRRALGRGLRALVQAMGLEGQAPGLFFEAESTRRKRVKR